MARLDRQHHKVCQERPRRRHHPCHHQGFRISRRPLQQQRAPGHGPYAGPQGVCARAAQLCPRDNAHRLRARGLGRPAPPHAHPRDASQGRDSPDHRLEDGARPQERRDTDTLSQGIQVPARQHLSRASPLGLHRQLQYPHIRRHRRAQACLRPGRLQAPPRRFPAHSLDLPRRLERA